MYIIEWSERVQCVLSNVCRGWWRPLVPVMMWHSPRLHHRANTPGEPVTPVHSELIRLTLSELSVSRRERADHRQVTLIELMEGGSIGPELAEPWENGDGWSVPLNWGQPKEVRFSLMEAVVWKGCVWLRWTLRSEQMCPCVKHNMGNMFTEMDLGRNLCEGWMNEWLHFSFSSRLSVQKDERPGIYYSDKWLWWRLADDIHFSLEQFRFSNLIGWAAFQGWWYTVQQHC